MAMITSLFIFTTVLATESQTVSPKISWQSLVLLKQKLRDESNAQERARIAQQIVESGQPLVAGSMAPSAAKAVAEARKSNRQLPEDQKDYVGFWLLRAVAAVEANNEAAGIEAGKVLTALGMSDSSKAEETRLMALLNTKGWLNAPEPAEKQNLIDALKKGDLNTAATEVDVLLQKYPQNPKLIAARNAIQTEIRERSLPGRTSSASHVPEANLTGRATLKISSTAFQEGENISSEFTCDGADMNPSMRFEKAPADTKSFVLIFDESDASAGLFTHWLVWNIDPKTAMVDQNNLSANGIQGRNDFGKTGYGGPCPQFGTHVYAFKVFALDRQLDLAAGSSRTAVEAQMRDHILGQAELLVRYSRTR